MTGPEAALAGCRLARNGAAMLLWGAFGYLSILVPQNLRASVGRRLHAVRIGAVAVAVLATLAALPITVATIGIGWPDALDPGMTRDVLFDTSVGLAWLSQAGGAVLLAATLLAPQRWRFGATALASGVILASLALTGHAAMHEGALGVAHRANDVVHVLAGGAWLGALLPLLPIVRALEDPGHRREAAVAVQRFSTVGHGAVALVIATGVINTLLVLGRWPTDRSSPYQALLATKIALVVLMTVIALAHRYYLVPRLSRDPRRVLRILRRGTLAEIALALLVLACVGVFGLLEPA